MYLREMAAAPLSYLYFSMRLSQKAFVFGRASIHLPRPCSTLLIPVVLFVPVKRGDFLHLLIAQFEIEHADIFLDVSGIA